MKTKLLIAAGLLATLSASAFAEDVPAKGEFNKNRQVTRAEFTKHADERFTKMDTNADGTLSLEERKAAHQKMREHRHDRKEVHTGDKKTPPPQ